MAKWYYLRNNAYDSIGKIEGSKIRILTQTEDFPNLIELDGEEEILAIEKFMEAVIDVDNSRDWEEFTVDDILDSNETLWEKEIPTDINEIRELSGLSGAKFAEKYHIPYRTYMDWVHRKTKPQSYLLELLERVVRIDFEKE